MSRYDPMMLRGKAAFVTGGETGIGRSIALCCAEVGAGVCVTGLQRDRIDEVVAEIDALGLEPAIGLVADIREPDQIDAIIDAVHRRWGRLDAAFANAGGGGPALKAAPAHELTLDEFQYGVSLNLNGAFLTMTAAARYLVKQGQGGLIMATGSSTAVRVVPTVSAYVAPKAGVHALVTVMALELATHKIRVNTLIPGPTDTPAMRAMPAHAEAAAAAVPLRELVDPEGLGRLAAFAASDAGRHMTGTQLKIDSGRTIA